NDGAAVLLLGSEEAGRRHGLTPLARIAGWAESATRPAEYPVASALALRRLAEKTRLAVDDFDIIEVNEAFACVPLICGRELHWDADRVNRWGGSVAMGHPIGATGAILTVKLMYELERTGGRYGIVSLCIGGGQGIATIFERVS
ncbi:MAG: hypothetical protein WHT63_10725, partial [Tepidiforma sp.]